MYLILLIIIPFIAALISLFVRKDIWKLEILAYVSALLELFCVFKILDEVVYKNVYSYGTYFSVDALGMIIMSIVAIIGFATTFYSVGYLREEVRKEIIGFHRVRQYFVLFHLFLMMMFLAISATNPVIMWIAIELTTFSTVFLVSFYNKPSSTEAAWKYLVINSVGLSLGFFGALLFFTTTSGLGSEGFVSWNILSQNASNFDPMIAKIAFIFIVIGYGTKAGLAPMHTWLPDAYSKAPSPISALLSGALSTVAFLAILRFKFVIDLAIGQSFSQNLLIFFGIFSLVISAFIILVQKNYKRLFAYSSIEHIGIILLGFGFGGVGVFAALLHMIYHSLAKAILFFISGNIFLKYGSTKIENIKGVLSVMPITGTMLFLGFLAITGVPPLGIFITEFNILSVGMSDHLFVVFVVLFLLALVFVGFLKHIMVMSFGEQSMEIKKGEISYLTITPIIGLFIVLVIFSLYLPTELRYLIDQAALSFK